MGAISVAGPALVVMVVVPDRPWWLFCVYAVAVMLAIFVNYSVAGRRSLAPVAHRLSAEERVA